MLFWNVTIPFLLPASLAVENDDIIRKEHSLFKQRSNENANYMVIIQCGPCEPSPQRDSNINGRICSVVRLEANFGIKVSLKHVEAVESSNKKILASQVARRSSWVEEVPRDRDRVRLRPRPRCVPTNKAVTNSNTGGTARVA